MRVYVASAGSYSDWHVVGIYSTKAAADEHCRQAAEDGEPNEVAEYELDAPTGYPAGMLLWRVPLQRNGDVGTHYGRFPEVVRADTRQDEHWMSYSSPCRNVEEEARCYGTRVFYCWAPDVESAVKLAGERRARILAAGNWPTQAEALAIVTKQHAERAERERVAYENARDERKPIVVQRKPEEPT